MEYGKQATFGGPLAALLNTDREGKCLLATPVLVSGELKKSLSCASGVCGCVRQVRFG